MDTALAQKFPFILDRNLAKAICTGNYVCTSCDRVVLVHNPKCGGWKSRPQFLQSVIIAYYKRVKKLTKSFNGKLASMNFSFQLMCPKKIL